MGEGAEERGPDPEAFSVGAADPRLLEDSPPWVHVTPRSGLCSHSGCLGYSCFPHPCVGAKTSFQEPGGLSLKGEAKIPCSWNWTKGQCVSQGPSFSLLALLGALGFPSLPSFPPSSPSLPLFTSLLFSSLPGSSPAPPSDNLPTDKL